MDAKQETEFQRLILAGRVPVDVLDGLRKLIGDIEDDAWQRGKEAGYEEATAGD